MMEPHDALREALDRLADAGDRVPLEGAIDPESLWNLVKFHLAPVCDHLANDLRRFSNGAWTLDVYILERPGYWSSWHDASADWHARWIGYGKSRIAQFYGPGAGQLFLAMPGQAPREFSHQDPEPAMIHALIERATTILRSGAAGTALS